MEKKIYNFKFINNYHFIFCKYQCRGRRNLLKAVSDQIQVLTKDLKTLEKAVYKNQMLHLQNISNLKNQVDLMKIF